MRRYYEILGLRPGATREEIRQSYRRLAKLYHPDRNPSEEAKHKFIQIQNAYEILTDDVRRMQYEAMVLNDSRNRQDNERRDQVYKVWIEHQQKQATFRQGNDHTGQRVNSTPPLSKGARMLHLVTNVFFMCLFAAILIVPIHRYFEQQKLPEAQQRSILFFIFPALLGVLFLCFGYYYWFVLKEDQKTTRSK